MHPAAPQLLPIARRERRAGDGRERVPEPMAMDSPASIEQFHASGATMAAMLAVYDLSAHSLDAFVPAGGRLLDLGVGSGRGLARFLQTRPDVHATGVDVAPEMLAEARRLVAAEGLGDRVTLVEADATALPDDLAQRPWDAVASVWALHHLPSRTALRAALDQVAALRERDGAAIWLLDFQRLRDPESFAALQAALEPDVPPTLHADAIASEAAAFTHAELRAEVAAAGLGELEVGLAQPIPWLQALWAPARRSTRALRAQARPLPLAGRAGDEAAALRKSFSRLPVAPAHETLSSR